METNSVRFEKCGVFAYSSFLFCPHAAPVEGNRPTSEDAIAYSETRRAGARRSKKAFLPNEAKFLRPYFGSMFLIISVLYWKNAVGLHDLKLLKTSEFEGEKVKNPHRIKPNQTKKFFPCTHENIQHSTFNATPKGEETPGF